MMKYIICFSVSLFMSCTSLMAQYHSSQEPTLEEAISWLEKKVNIAYYNAQTQEWWSNRFFYSNQTGIVNIKNTSSDGPSFLSRSNYYDRKVLLSDLDAGSIEVYDVNQDKGRIVYGQVVQVNVIGNQKKIQRTKNDMASFKEFFLQIPVPHTFDSLRLTADSIKSYLALAIELKSKINPTKDAQQNIDTILSMLHGQFVGTDDTNISFTKISETDFEMEHKRGGVFITEGLIGYDSEKQSFYQWVIHKGKRRSLVLNIQSEELVSIQSPGLEFQMILHGLNHFTIIDSQSVQTDYFRKSD